MSSQRSSTATGPVHTAAARIGEVEIEALAREACEAGVSLTRHVSDLVSIRAIDELVAPSPIWRAIPTASSEIELELSPEAHAMVERVCEVAGYPEDVILSNLAAGGPPRPTPELRLGFLRTEPGKGRIFGMYFEVAGFQYALLRHLAGDTLSIGRVLDSAFIALARQTATSGFLNGLPISQAARQFASKVIMIENRRRIPDR